MEIQIKSVSYDNSVIQTQFTVRKDKISSLSTNWKWKPFMERF